MPSGTGAFRGRTPGAPGIPECTRALRRWVARAEGVCAVRRDPGGCGCSVAARAAPGAVRRRRADHRSRRYGRTPAIVAADPPWRRICSAMPGVVPLRSASRALRLERLGAPLSARPELSILIPSFNEELRLPGSLERIAGYIREKRPNTEVLVVDDSSTDRTAEIAESWREKIPQLRVLSNGTNRGKGFSVRHGSLEARGGIILFTDADLSSPIEEGEKLFAALQSHDVAIGSRGVG